MLDFGCWIEGVAVFGQSWRFSLIQNRRRKALSYENLKSSVCHRVDFPANPLRREDRAVNAYPFVRFITKRRLRLHGHDAADADAEAAAHRRFERNQTVDIERGGNLGDAPHHHPWAAGVDRRTRTIAFAQVSFE